MAHVYMDDKDEERLKSIAARNNRKVVNQVGVVLDIYERVVGQKREDELGTPLEQPTSIDGRP